jgi:hypothetical protein
MTLGKSGLLTRAAGIVLATGTIAAVLAAPAQAATLPAPTVSSSDYPATACAGGIGHPGRFTFSANGSTDVVGFQYGPDFPSTYVSADQPGGTATVTITPNTFGIDKVAVKSVDAAGDTSPITAYWYCVNGG